MKPMFAEGFLIQNENPQWHWKARIPSCWVDILLSRWWCRWKKKSFFLELICIFVFNQIFFLFCFTPFYCPKVKPFTHDSFKVKQPWSYHLDSCLSYFLLLWCWCSEAGLEPTPIAATHVNHLWKKRSVFFDDFLLYWFAIVGRRLWSKLDQFYEGKKKINCISSLYYFFTTEKCVIRLWLLYFRVFVACLPFVR